MREEKKESYVQIPGSGGGQSNRNTTSCVSACALFGGDVAVIGGAMLVNYLALSDIEKGAGATSPWPYIAGTVDAGLLLLCCLFSRRACRNQNPNIHQDASGIAHSEEQGPTSGYLSPY
jgi:hypothetical protein